MRQLTVVRRYSSVDRRHDRLELPRGEIHLFRSRVLGDGFSVDRVRLCNHSTRTIDVPLWFSFGADFADIFEVRGTRRPRRGSLLPVQLGESAVLPYIGLDNVERRTILRWTRTPDAIEEGVARFLVRLAPREAISFDLTVACEEDAAERTVTDYESALNQLRAVHLARAQSSTLR